MNWAEAATAMAVKEIGKGEEGGNNDGPEVRKYRGGEGGNGSWCAAFVSWCLEQSWYRITLGAKIPIIRSHGAKRIYKRVGKAGSFHDVPKRGDVVCWHRGKKGSWKGHVGIVGKVQGSSFWSIEGNRGRYPARVAVYRHELDEAMLMGFARLPSWVKLQKES